MPLRLAALALAEGTIPAEAAGFRESLALFRAWGNCRGIVECLSGLGQTLLAFSGGKAELERASALLGHAESYFAAAGATMWPPDRLAFAAARTELEKRLPAPQLRISWSRGRALTLDQAITLALSDGRAVSLEG